MASLKTKYVGLDLSTPIILASAGTTEKAELIKRAEDNGAGAAVMKSLFEKEVTRIAPTPRFKLIHHNMAKHKTWTLYSYEQASIWGPERYSKEIEKAKKEVRIPVIASINCITDEGWASYARYTEEAGADALEINVSCPHGSITFTGEEVVDNILKVVELVKEEVSIPVIPKLSPQLTMPGAVVKSVEKIGANGVAIFNRLTGLEIDVEKEAPVMHGGYAGHGGPWAIQYPLRWVSQLSPETSLDISATSGVSSAEDVVKYLLAGAKTVQVCTLIYLRGFEIIDRLNRGVMEWMDGKGYQKIEDFRGKVSGSKILGIDEVDRAHNCVAVIDNDLCSACGLCEKVCIYFAPQKVDDKFEITDKCDGCGLCPELCPKKAIRMAPD